MEKQKILPPNDFMIFIAEETKNSVPNHEINLKR